MAEAAYLDEIDDLALAQPASPVRGGVPATRSAPRAVAQRRASSPKSDAGSILGAIMNAASNAAIDADKVERLMAMYRQIRADEARQAYLFALPLMQNELPMIDQNGRIVIRDKGGERIIQETKYARWEDINEAIQPVLFRHGFGLSFRLSAAPDGKQIVTCVLSHRDGHQEETSITLMHDSTGSKNSVQAVGSTISYGQRYTARALTNFQSRAREDRDDDGKAAGAGETISAGQVDQLRLLIDETGSDIRRFCAHFKIGALIDLPSGEFGRALTMLNAKRKAS
ncbi:ERF family protein [Roseixanthobacter pseudopolyaromaticivorans]|uniref:ERF family protein n=1 Tax=Xanthobacteraceae TaxID=335928 RepID=UPI0037288121